MTDNPHLKTLADVSIQIWEDHRRFALGLSNGKAKIVPFPDAIVSYAGMAVHQVRNASPSQDFLTWLDDLPSQDILQDLLIAEYRERKTTDPTIS